MQVIPYGRQYIDAADVSAVVDVLHSDWLTQGPSIREFETAVAEYCGAKFAVAVSNATAALHLACRALSLGEGDALWTSPNTFVASANCARYCGAEVDFVDIDAATLNMDVGLLEEKLVEARRNGCLPKVVIPVHFGGQPCDMARLAQLSDEYGFDVVEDASHAIGSRYKGSITGACRYSAISVFSFHPVKVMTTGEGGMLLTNNRELFERLVLLRTHGITREPVQMEYEPDGPWYYEQVELGFNYRMTDLQAALGRSQLEKLDMFVSRRRELAARYRDLMKTFPVGFQEQPTDIESAFHLFPIRVDSSPSGADRATVFQRLREAGIAVNVHYIPVHTQPYYRKLGFAPGQFPVSEHYYSQALSLPMYYGLSDEEQNYVVDSLQHALGA